MNKKETIEISRKDLEEIIQSLENCAEDTFDQNTKSWIEYRILKYLKNILNDKKL